MGLHLQQNSQHTQQTTHVKMDVCMLWFSGKSYQQIAIAFRKSSWKSLKEEGGYIKLDYSNKINVFLHV